MQSACARDAGDARDDLKGAKKGMNEGWLTKRGREYVIVETGNDGKQK